MKVRYISILFAILFLFSPFSSAISEKSTFTLWQLPSQSGHRMNSYVIQTVHGKVITIDGGYPEDSPYLKGLLAALGNKVDIWFVTHQHGDHIWAITKILENPGDLVIDKIYGSLLDVSWVKANSPGDVNMAKTFNESLKKAQKQVIELKLGQIIKVDGLTIEILGVKNPEITVNPVNNSSVVMRVYDNQKSVLFLADLGVEGGEKLLKTKYKNHLQSDYVQMAHHGQNGVSEDFYKIVNPKYCIWPTSKRLWNNASGKGEDSGPWKTKEVRAWMNNLNIKKNYYLFDGLVTIR
jgi:beta-lactamase superfamily II metal-dependent hydrolase